MQTRNPWVGTALIVMVGAGLGLGFNTLHPRPLPWIAKPIPVISLETSASENPVEHSGQVVANTSGPEDASSTISSGAGTSPTAEPATPNQPTPAESPDRGRLTGGPGDVAVGPAPGKSSIPPGESPAAPGASYADIPESEYPIEISLAKAKEFYDRGGLLVLDAREAGEFSEGHIQGAISAPTDEKMADLEWLDIMAKDPRPIMVYCGGGECELSLELGFEIGRAGHRRVLVFKDGYSAWKDAGYPVAEGSIP